jgi:CRISPR/Cas system CSM-associated protein Csm2 small subunit
MKEMNETPLDNVNDININSLTNKINDLYDDAFKSVYEIVKRNNETIIKTKNYYLVNLDNVKTETIKELSSYLKYLDVSFDHLTNDENEKNKLRNELSKID